MKLIRATGVASLFLLMSLELSAQPETPRRVFEVASIRPHQGPLRIIDTFSTSGPRLRAEGATVRGLVAYAYGLKNYQLPIEQGLSAFVGVYFEVAAKAEGDGEPRKDEFRQMLQSLLEDRFKLKVHREMREMQVYALVVGKNGPKFKESAADANFSGNHGVNGRNQTFVYVGAPMGRIAEAFPLSFGVDRPVVDKTGLTGTYDVKFEATPEYRINRNPDVASDPNEISVFTAVQQQLGLKLEAQKAMIEVLVVDHVEKPSEN